jgi:arylsulfatase A-like enzyme
MAELEVPWIAAGREIVAGQEIELPVSVMDTAPAMARVLGIEPHRCWAARAPAIFRTR